MFRFAAQEFLFALLLIPVAAAFVWYAVLARRNALAKLGNPEILARLTASINMTGRKFRIALLFPTLAFLSLALARPQFGTRMETVQREGQDIVVAIDDERPSAHNHDIQSITRSVFDFDIFEIAI